MFDFHMHSRFSCDSQGDLREMVAGLKEKGFQQCCFTEHLDAWQEKGSDAIDAMIPDFPAYLALIRDVQKEETSLSVKFGVEVGFCDSLIPSFSEILKAYPFDFIICSQHLVGTQDPYYQVYFDGKTQKEAYSLYLAEILRILRQVDNYDVVGHIGYLTRYWPGSEPKALTYQDHSDLIDEILRHAIQNGKGIELNTSGFLQTGDFLPTQKILSRYFALGGEILTIGSDAHSAAQVGFMIPEAIEFVKSLGARYLCTFSARRPEFHKL